MAYRNLLKLECLPKEDYTILKRMVDTYGIPGKSSEAYSLMVSCLLHVVEEVERMQEAHIADGASYVQGVVTHVMSSYL